LHRLFAYGGSFFYFIYQGFFYGVLPQIPQTPAATVPLHPRAAGHSTTAHRNVPERLTCLRQGLLLNYFHTEPVYPSKPQGAVGRQGFLLNYSEKSLLVRRSKRTSGRREVGSCVTEQLIAIKSFFLIKSPWRRKTKRLGTVFGAVIACFFA